MSTRKERARAAKHTRGEREGKTATPSTSEAQPLVGIGGANKRSDAGTVRPLTRLANNLKTLADIVARRERERAYGLMGQPATGPSLSDAELVVALKDIEHEIRDFDQRQRVELDPRLENLLFQGNEA